MNKERLTKVLLSPRVTEKSARVGDTANQFVFKVAKDASKPEIKQAVEMMFSVKVDQVQVLNVKPKQKMFRRNRGSRPGWKKAYVRLKPGFDIDYTGAE
jgi:large subunit ribosomal protein L23